MCTLAILQNIFPESPVFLNSRRIYTLGRPPGQEELVAAEGDPAEAAGGGGGHVQRGGGGAPVPEGGQGEVQGGRTEAKSQSEGARRSLSLASVDVAVFECEPVYFA